MFHRSTRDKGRRRSLPETSLVEKSSTRARAPDAGLLKSRSLGSCCGLKHTLREQNPRYDRSCVANRLALAVAGRSQQKLGHVLPGRVDLSVLGKRKHQVACSGERMDRAPIIEINRFRQLARP